MQNHVQGSQKLFGNALSLPCKLFKLSSAEPTWNFTQENQHWSKPRAPVSPFKNQVHNLTPMRKATTQNQTDIAPRLIKIKSRNLIAAAFIKFQQQR